jgi:uroporphyrinogen decarboxylase
MAFTRRKRCLTALNGGIPDRPPISFDIAHNCNDNIAKVYSYYGASKKNDLFLAAGIDGFSVWEWNSIGGEFKGVLPRADDGIKLDFWGNAYPGHFGLSNCDNISSLENHNWPKVSDFDFSNVYREAKAIQGQDMVVAAGHLGLGYQMHNMLRGNEKALFDLCNPDYMQVYTKYISNFTIRYIESLLRAGRGLIDVVRADDDIGTMDRLMISPDMWRKYYKPLWKKAFDIVHKYGAKVWFHSCGHIRPLLEDLVEIGVDCWNPFPGYVKGNDHNWLSQWRKDKISLDGGVNHFVMVGGNRLEIVEETKRVLDTFATDGGLLIGPSQVFTPDVPADNIIAFFETCLKYNKR